MLNTLAFKEPTCLFLVTQNDLCAFNRNNILRHFQLSLSLYFVNFFSESSILSVAFGVLVVRHWKSENRGKTFSLGIEFIWKIEADITFDGTSNIEPIEKR